MSSMHHDTKRHVQRSPNVKHVADCVGHAFVVSAENRGMQLLKSTMHCSVLSKPCPEQGNLMINLTARARP